ncbi:MAG: HAMP domain-containing sensor histidine kinase [Gammaproteobacteria bacterium]|nr:HAMP domain-containing sensor histidine kinase [Gammaproteobacteria bacterium]
MSGRVRSRGLPAYGVAETGTFGRDIENISSQGDRRVTPEAVIYRYLHVANTEPVEVSEFVRLIGTDADLLGRWLTLMMCPASPDALETALNELDADSLKRLAEAQAWSVLPGLGTARLGFDQWRNVLQAACLGQALAGYVGLPELEALRWKILLAISGVNLDLDPVVGDLIEFRGTPIELLEDASPLLKIFAVVDAMESTDVSLAGLRAVQLLDVNEETFSGICNQADSDCQALLNRFDILDENDVDWAERFWTQLQVSMLAGLFSDCRNLPSLYGAHRFASRSLFGAIPLLLLLDDDSQALQPADSQALQPAEGGGVHIRLGSTTSAIAQSMQEDNVLMLQDSPRAAVADRQVLRTLKAAEGLCVPLTSDGERAGVLVFVVEEDVDHEFAMRIYARELARRIIVCKRERSDDMALIDRYRQREEKRLREIVHEANNPLSIVHNYLHILELRLQHEPSAREQLNMIGTELKRAGDIIQRIKDIADPENDDSAVFAEFDVNELARRIFELHRGYAEDHQVTLHLELSLGLLPVTSDEQRLSQVLINLMRNAIEASPGRDVTMLSAAGVFREGLEGVEIGVRDTGPGLPRAVLDKLAEPKTSSKGDGHSGLGLHIVHRIIGELGGSIDVRTLLGQGTGFTVFLPLEAPL